MHAKLQHLLCLPSVDILNESDEQLGHKFQLVYAWGTQCGLPSASQRILMIQHVLEVVSKDLGVRAALLGDPDMQQPDADAIETEAAT